MSVFEYAARPKRTCFVRNGNPISPGADGVARFGGVANTVVRCGESIVLFRVTEFTVQPSTYQASASQPACEERGTDLGH